MKIFVTGANGFIGSQLINKLLLQGHEVHALVRKLPTQSQEKLNYYEGDITDQASVDRAMAGCEQVYHVAGYAKLWARQRRTFFDINVTGTENILRACIRQGVRRMVYTSSCAVFGPSLKTPVHENSPRITAYDNDYDLSKCLAEATVRDYGKKGIETVIVNPSRVYGPGPRTHANMITQMLVKSLQGKPVLMPGIKKVIGNYAFIDDVVNGHIRAMEKGRPGERYIVGGENLSYEEVITIVKEEIPGAKLLPLPMGAVRAWGYIELLKHAITGKDPAFTPSAVKRYLHDAAFDCTKARHELGYHVTGFREGVRKTIQELRPEVIGEGREEFG